jgi:hypothetical protein
MRRKNLFGILLSTISRAAFGGFQTLEELKQAFPLAIEFDHAAKLIAAELPPQFH